jgi:hypothetical protein
MILRDKPLISKVVLSHAAHNHGADPQRTAMSNGDPTDEKIFTKSMLSP